MARHTRFSTLAMAIGLGIANAQHVLLPFSHRPDIPALSARASEQTKLKKSNEYPYVVDVSVGEPPQKLSLLISPSTGHTWVPDANTPDCSPDWYYDGYDWSEYAYKPEPECLWGSYNQSKSTTYLPANQRYTEFYLRTIDGAIASGANMTDKLVVGGIELDDYPMGIGSSANRWIGTLGLGYNASSEYSTYYDNYYETGSYATFMDRIVASGKVASPAYSMWLNDAEGTGGSLLFGAVDQSRYTGDLVRIKSSTGSYSYSYGWATSVASINGTDGSGDAMPAIRSNDFPVDVTIGPGEVLSYLPGLLADQIAEMAGATYNESLEYFMIACDAGKTKNARFEFELSGSGGPRLSVETADLVLPTSIASGNGRGSKLRRSGTDQCLFGIQKYYSSSSSSSSGSSSSSYPYNLGSSVLRRSYLVFDLANNEIGLAPVKFASGSNAPSSEIVAFANYGATIPSAKLFCTDSWYCSSSYDDSGSGPGSGSGGNRSGPYRDEGSGLQHWQKVAIGVGVSFGVLVIIGVICTVIICTRLRRGDGPGKELDEEGNESDTPPAESSSPAMAQTGTRGSVVLPPGSLPVIQEGSEPSAAPAPSSAPQIPALGEQTTRPITPPEPTASANSNRASVAVSALSDEQPEATQTPAAAAAAAPSSPKGKGKEMDRSAAES